MTSVLVTVAPRLRMVSSCVTVIMSTEIDPGKVVTIVVSAPVTVATCGGSVTVVVETMVDPGIATVAAGMVTRTVEAGAVIVVKDPEIEVVIVEPAIVDVTTSVSTLTKVEPGSSKVETAVIVIAGSVINEKISDSKIDTLRIVEIKVENISLITVVGTTSVENTSLITVVETTSVETDNDSLTTVEVVVTITVIVSVSVSVEVTISVSVEVRVSVSVEVTVCVNAGRVTVEAGNIIVEVGGLQP